MKTGWTEEEYDYLRELAAHGLTAGQISRALSEKFGHERTRNAIIGASHRIHVRVGSPNIGSLRSAKKRRRLPRKIKFKILPPKEKLMIEPVMPRPKREPPWSVSELTSHTCRWIDGDPRAERPFACGQEKAFDKPYCNAHLKRAFGPSHKGRINHANP